MMYWDPNPDLFIIPILNWPIKWYGVLFALGFALGFPVFRDILRRYFKMEGASEVEKKALMVTDQITLSVVIGTVVGARIGHFLFYERPMSYLRDPMDLLRVWEGGLASHGAVIGIVAAVWIFSFKARKIDAGLDALRLLDYLVVPTALAAVFIRIGNFINQEILGTPTNLPWAVIFGHPADGSLPVPRHPAQLYEAAFYCAVFFALWRLSFSKKWLQAKGQLLGLFLVSVFGFRFLVEFAKLEQSRFLDSTWTMGQWLSLPLVAGGLILLMRRKRV